MVSQVRERVQNLFSTQEKQRAISEHRLIPFHPRQTAGHRHFSSLHHLWTFTKWRFFMLNIFLATTFCSTLMEQKTSLDWPHWVAQNLTLQSWNETVKVSFEMFRLVVMETQAIFHRKIPFLTNPEFLMLNRISFEFSFREYRSKYQIRRASDETKLSGEKKKNVDSPGIDVIFKMLELFVEIYAIETPVFCLETFYSTQWYIFIYTLSTLLRKNSDFFSFYWKVF